MHASTRPGSWSVVAHQRPDNMVGAIRTLRGVTKFGLRKSRLLLSDPPAVCAADLERDVAELLAHELAQLGTGAVATQDDAAALAVEGIDVRSVHDIDDAVRQAGSGCTATVVVAGLAILVLAALGGQALWDRVGGDDPTTDDPTVTDGAPRDDADPATVDTFTQRNTTLTGVTTDNYKASFNEDPDTPELRTWLSIENATIGGTTFMHTVDASDDGFTITESARLSSDDDDERLLATSTLTAAGDGVTVVTRSGPQEGRWGPLLTLPEQMTADSDPVEVCIDMRRPNEQQPVGTICASYVYDAELAMAPSDSLEHNGPGGRWHVNGEPTRTNLEAGWQ